MDKIGHKVALLSRHQIILCSRKWYKGLTLGDFAAEFDPVLRISTSMPLFNVITPSSAAFCVRYLAPDIREEFHLLSINRESACHSASMKNSLEWYRCVFGKQPGLL